MVKAITDAYRWQRRLGHRVIETGGCGIVADPAHPDLWDANHADNVTASTDDAINAVLAAMDEHLAHTPWRVVHTDAFTPEPFLARLAYLGFEERPLVIQMACDGPLEPGVSPAGLSLVPIAVEEEWNALAALVRDDIAEGKRTGYLELDAGFADQMVAGYRAKAPVYRFHLALLDGRAVGYGAMAVAQNGMGMIEDLFTTQAARGRGIASALIGQFGRVLRSEGCHAVFLGAVAEEQAKSLYYRLGFRPVTLSRCWVKKLAG